MAATNRAKPARVWYGNEHTRQATRIIKGKTGLSVAHIRQRAFQIGLEALLANPTLAYNPL